MNNERIKAKALERNAYGSMGNIGLNHFVFHPFKTEKERIQESLEMNKYSTEPINLPVLQHKFRERDKSKEIQPDMKFYCRREPTSIPTSIHFSSSMTSNGDNSDAKKKRLYLKSTYSMLLHLGSLKSHTALGLNTDARLYEVLAAELSKLNRGSTSPQAKQPGVKDLKKLRQTTANLNNKATFSRVVSKVNGKTEDKYEPLL